MYHFVAFHQACFSKSIIRNVPNDIIPIFIVSLNLIIDGVQVPTHKICSMKIVVQST